MKWIYSDSAISKLYSKWGRLGWRSTEDIFKKDIDIEELIAETTHAARYDGRLLQVLMTWIRDFGDLVNKRKLLKCLNQADTALLGAVLDIAMKYGGDQNFTPVIKQCHPLNPAEVLIKGLDEIETYITEQKKHGKEEFRKWGLFCTSIEFYEDAFRTREWILSKNKNLALRAVFGANVRSEILYYLDMYNDIGIRQLSRNLGYAYSGVYREIEEFRKNGLIKEKKGKGRIVMLSDKMKKIIHVAENVMAGLEAAF
jgi:DNA-binding transcriptional ArsR family regulator